MATPAVLDAMVRKVKPSKAPDLAELETQLGWHYLPEAVMFDVVTRYMCQPSLTLRYDWMHGFFVNGAFNVQAGLLVWELYYITQFTDPALHEIVKQFH